MSPLSDKYDFDNLCNASVEHDVYTQIGQHNIIEHKAGKVVIDLALKEMCQWINIDLTNRVGERSMYVTR